MIKKDKAMRILVISDSHGNRSGLKEVLLWHTDISHVFFLGDNTSDIDALKDSFKEKTFYIVSGNCDGFSFYKNTDIATIGEVKVFFTHGHHFGVKSGIERLTEAARQRDCRLALFGHTHSALTVYDNGITIVNPGSLGHTRNGSNSYAIIDVLPSGIVTSIMTID